MPGHECYHCKLWIEEGDAHDCWTTTEAALTEDLSEDLRDAWDRLREAAVELGEQRIYASGSCIMFSRDVCYFFVRPKRSFLEVSIFLGRALKAPQVRRAEPKSKTKFANILQIRHRDEVEPPMTDWLQEAYALPEAIKAAAAISGSRVKAQAKRKPQAKLKPKPKTKAKAARKTGAAKKPTRR